MSIMLASDDNNTDFVGARNPDSGLVVKFYRGKVQNNYETELKGRPIFNDVDMVKIFTPGNDKNIIDTFVREDHKQRFPLKWHEYLNSKNGETSLSGTPVEFWPQITPAQAEELKAMKFFTVESIANATDQNIMRIQMVGGMAPFSFREKAVKFLQIAQQVEQTNETDKKLQEIEAEKEAMRLQLAENNAKLEAMQAQMAQLLAPKKRGRKPKAETLEE